MLSGVDRSCEAPYAARKAAAFENILSMGACNFPPKGLASMGIEPTTFALLARRSNQLS